MQLTRLPNNPVIWPHMDERMGDNINGPSIIRVPDWIDQPLGRYYLYFGHHDGAYIRLAYADDVSGPWHMHEPGVLPLADSGFAGHIASPDVHVDHADKRIRMYFHGSQHPTGVEDAPQHTRVATSSNGLDFTAGAENLGLSYFRVFAYNDYYYALQMPGLMLRSKDPLSGFEPGPTLFDSNMRHSAVSLEGDRLRVIYSRVGDTPESLLQCTIDLSRPWNEWTTSPSSLVLAPTLDYEGANAPLEPSSRGLALKEVNQLRDPALLFDERETWLAYSVAGERGIAIAKIESLD